MQNKREQPTFPMFWDGERVVTPQMTVVSSIDPSIDKHSDPWNFGSNLKLTPIRTCPIPGTLPSIQYVLKQTPLISPHSTESTEITLSNLVSPSTSEAIISPVLDSVDKSISPSNSRRPRRRYHEITRKFPCIYEGCLRAYGALNHLNYHIVNDHKGSRLKAKNFPYMSNYQTPIYHPYIPHPNQPQSQVRPQLLHQPQLITFVTTTSRRRQHHQLNETFIMDLKHIMD